MSKIEWVKSQFTEVFDIQGGTQPPKSQFIDSPQKGYVRLLQIRDFGQSPVPTYIPDTKTIKKCKEDDILIGRYGASVGRICTGMSGAYNVALAKVITPDFIDKTYLKHWLNSELFQAPLRLIQRTAQNGFNKEDLAKIEFQYPKKVEDQVKVSKRIENLFFEIDKGIQELENAESKIKIYRQSVLNAAIQGKLVAQDLNDEPASKLLEKVRAEKESLIKKGIIKKEKEIPKLKNEEIPFDVPESWVVAMASEIVSPGDDIVYGIVQPGPKLSKGVPYVRGMDIVDGQIQVNQLLNTSKEIAKKYERASLKGGDILLGIIRATKVAIVPDVLGGANITQGTARFRPSKAITTEYLALVLESHLIQNWLHEHYRGIDMPGLNLADVRRTPIPLPSINEQNRITNKVKELLGFGTATLKVIEKSLLDAKQLKQSILKKAFEGDL